VFVVRRDRGLRLASLDDPRLRRLTIGVHVMGDDYANSPAELALNRRGLRRNLVGFSIYGDYSRPVPPADLLRAVERGDVDVAVAWGPLAGWYASRSRVPLVLTPVRPETEVPFNQFVYDVAVGVRRRDTLRRGALDRELSRRAADIASILASYHVPVPDASGRFAP
jgi:mxaJ protein